MHFISLHIREFGGIRDLSLSFTGGMNLIYGSNESGKSTLIAFIRFMLYGLPKRAAGETLSDGDRAFSWENGVADGSLTVEKNGSRYRIERREQMQSPKKLLQIVDEATGQPTYKGEVPGLVFLGIPMQVFDSTACIRQLRTGQIDGEGLSHAIENLLLTGDESVSTEKALGDLDKARKTLLHKNGKGGEIYRLEGEIATLEYTLSEIRRTASELISERLAIDTLEAEINEKKKELKKASDRLAVCGDLQVLKRFSALRAESERVDLQEKKLEELRKQHIRNGRLPDDHCIRALEASAQTLEYAEREQIRAEAERRIAASAPAYDAEQIEAAGRICRMGGEEAILERIRCMSAERRSASNLPVLFLLLASALAVLGVSLALLLHRPILFVLLAGGLLVIPAVKLLKKNKRSESALTSYLAEIGITDATANPETAVSAYISRVFRTEALENERFERIRAAENAAALATEQLKEKQREAREAGGAFLPENASITPTLLRKTAEELRMDLGARELAEHTLRVYEQSYQRSANALKEFDEEALLARLPADITAESIPDPELLREKCNRITAELRGLEERRLDSERRLSALEATRENPEAVEAQLFRKRAEKDRLSANLRAILLAGEAIEIAREGLKSRISPRLRKDATDYLSRLTGGKHSTVAISPEFSLSSEENGRVHHSDAFSGGTKDAMYLSLRLSLTALLSEKDDPLPILLDEALAQLDDDRARALLLLLADRASASGQVLLFTCHTRESRMLADENVNRITLA